MGWDLVPEDCEVFEGCEFCSHRWVLLGVFQFEVGGVGDLDGQAIVGARREARDVLLTYRRTELTFTYVMFASKPKLARASCTEVGDEGW